VSVWSAQLAIKQEIIEERLRLADVKTRCGVKIPALVMFRALKGDLEEARAREATARASLMEFKLQVRNREVISSDEKETKFCSVLLPIRQLYLSLPAQASSICNPSDPQTASLAVYEWVKDSFPTIRGEIARLEAQRAKE